MRIDIGENISFFWCNDWLRKEEYIQDKGQRVRVSKKWYDRVNDKSECKDYFIFIKNRIGWNEKGRPCLIKKLGKQYFYKVFEENRQPPMFYYMEVISIDETGGEEIKGRIYKLREP